MIEINALSKSYGHQHVLKGIDLRLENGQCTALIGPNGSGKTTLIKCLLQLVKPEGGVIRFCGNEIHNDYQYRSTIGYMPQLSRFPEHMKVRQLFNLMRSLRSDAIGYDTTLCDDLDIASFSHRPLGVLSEGMKQKVSASLAFYFDPKVLILDEPTAGLDPVANEILKTKITWAVKQDKLVLITSHILSDLDDITSRVVYLMDGQIWINKSLDELKKETQQSGLNKIIAHLLNELNGSPVKNNQISTS